MATNALATRIQQARSEAQLSVMDVSKLVAVNPDTYKRWENGGSEPRINKLTTLAGVLAVSPGWLLGGDEQHAGVVSPDDQVGIFQLRIQQLTAFQSRTQETLDKLSRDLEEYTRSDKDMSA